MLCPNGQQGKLMSDLPLYAQAMLRPDFYPEPTSKVELVQTQMSFVFLTDHFAYKTKKAVNLGYLDYSELSERKTLSEKELVLNRRLCDYAYLEVLPVTKNEGGYSLGGCGEVVEYTLKMRRLPEDRMLINLLSTGGVSSGMLEKLAEKLAVFHQTARTDAEVQKYGNLEAIKYNTEENFEQTGSKVGLTVSPGEYARISSFTRSFISDNQALFNARVNGGKIRDCHGDLHAAHICFMDNICIYDCIEFNDRFRYGDVASEVAFLAMDLDHYGKADLSRLFVNSYIQKSKDTDLYKLLRFYKCYRAYIRGKVEGFKLDDPYISEAEKAKYVQKSKNYYHLADFYAKPNPTLFITTGFCGCGKSTLAQSLAEVSGSVVISSDIVRKGLSNIDCHQHCFEDADQGIYSPEMTKKTYQAMFDQAGNALKEGYSVILDATFLKEDQRKQAEECASQNNAKFVVLEVKLSPELAKKRLEERLDKQSVSDGRWEVYLKQIKSFEPLAVQLNRVIIDSSKPTDKQLSDILEFFKSNQGE